MVTLIGFEPEESAMDIRPIRTDADLVTEMGSVKHHFSAGVKAQEGIEF